MAYIGSKPNDTRQLARREFSYAVTVASTTTFTGSDAGGKTLSYQPGELEVYMNGVRLDPADYTATTGSSVVLGSGANIGDNINIFAGQTLPTDDYVSKAAGGTFDGDVLFNTTNTLPAINNVEGVAISAGSYGGRLEVSRNSNEAVAFNRMNTDGNILAIKKDGTTVGTIGTNTNGNFQLHGSATSHVGLQFGSPSILPINNSGASSDNAVDLGDSNVRFKDAYLSGGVYLGGTGSANKLDDYEEGTWEPTLQGTGGDPTVTYNADTGGSYTKIGRMVYLTGAIRWSSAPNGGSGTAMIGGLPFTNAPRTNGDNADGISSARAVLWNGTSSRTPTAVGMKASNANLNLFATSSSSPSITIQISDVGSNCMIQFSAVIYTT